jgi:hypothetical protein
LLNPFAYTQIGNHLGDDCVVDDASLLVGEH